MGLARTMFGSHRMRKSALPWSDGGSWCGPVADRVSPCSMVTLIVADYLGFITK